MADNQPSGAPRDDTKGFSVPTSLAAGVALLVSALAALGVSGDILTRAVRNAALWLVVVVIGILFAMALPLWMSRTRVGWKVAVGVLVVGLSVGVGVGAHSVNKREQPSITIVPVQDAVGNITVTVEAKASSLRVEESMLVQVVGLKAFDQLTQTGPIAACETNHAETRQAAQPRDYRLPDQIGDLLLWNRLGPSVTGTISVTFKLDIPAKRYSAVCGWAVLSNRRVRPSIRDVRTSAAYVLLLPRLPASSTPSPSPTT